MTSARQQVVDAVAPILPKSWKLVPYLRDLDKLTQPVVMFHATSVARHPVTPLGAYSITFEATVLDPSTDPERAWEVLDDEVLEVIAGLDTIEALDWTGAEPVVVSNYFGWTITFTVPYTHTEE